MAKLTNEEVTELRRLQKLLREQQRALVLAAAKGTSLPPRRAIQEIAELESAIIATDAVLQDG
ncbi:hypothetical protein WDZ92_25075 [Nostoc sp. NIES-2111]